MRTLKLLFLCLLATLTCLNSFANRTVPGDEDQKLYPASILVLDDTFSHHIVVAEKSTHKVHLFKNNDGIPEYVKSYNAATGKRKGNKFIQGDLKTPEGIYHLNSFIPSSELISKYGKEGEIYGAGAFVTDYPNPIDRIAGKTGGGIWLHSTNDDARIDKGLDSRGCVVIVDEDLKDIAKYIDLKHTNIIVVEDLLFLPKKNWMQKREEVLAKLSSWVNSWQQEDFDTYISHYHKKNFRDPIRGYYPAFKNYKKAVFSGAGTPSINISNVSVITHHNYAVAQFTQDYRSERISDIGKKIIYLQLDNNYDWKIVSEAWQSLPEAYRGKKVAFVPKQRYFDSE